ncbi:MAG: iron ABC transporter permease [Pseudomonadota bacterium]
MTDTALTDAHIKHRASNYSGARWRIWSVKPSDAWHEREGGGLALITLLTIAILCVVPVAQLVFAASRVFTGDGEAMALLTSSTLSRATGNTLVIAVGSTAFALVYGVAVAVVLSAMKLRTERALAFLFVLSLMVAPQVSALAFKTLAGPSSPILNTLGLAPPIGTRNPMLSFGGIIFVMGLHHAPLVAITVAAGLSRVPKALVEASLLDGANAWQVISRVILPVMRLHVLAATLLAFVAGVGNFGIPALLGLPAGITTLPTLVFRQLASFGQTGINDAALVSLVIALIAGVAVVASAIVMSRRDVRVDSGATFEPFVDNLIGKLIAEATLWVVFALTIILPLLSLLATSLVPAYGVTLNWETLTFSQFTDVLWRQALVQRAFLNSFLYAGSAAMTVGCLALVIAYAVDRRLARAKPLMLCIVEMPYALPGVVIAIACILMFVRPLPVIGISVYGTAWIIIFAYLASFLAIGLKPVMASVSSLDTEVEEAALIDGATVGERVRKIIGPLVLPSIVAGALMVFLLAFNELTISALLWSAGTETLGVALLNLDDAGLGAESAALAVAATAIIAIIMGIMEALSRYFPDHSLPWRQIANH